MSCAAAPMLSERGRIERETVCWRKLRPLAPVNLDFEDLSQPKQQATIPIPWVK
jgi:hypothetical protein